MTTGPGTAVSDVGLGLDHLLTAGPQGLPTLPSSPAPNSHPSPPAASPCWVAHSALGCGLVLPGGLHVLSRGSS